MTSQKIYEDTRKREQHFTLRRTLDNIVYLVLPLLFLSPFIAMKVMGWSWNYMTTPSMGTAAPVGSLVVTKPSKTFHAGDIVTFISPGSKSYTHRIVEISNGFITTKGDINPVNDGFQTPISNIIGKEVVTLHGVGFIVQAWWILLIGWLVTYLLGRFVVDKYWSRPTYVLGTSLTISIACVLVKPFVNFAILGSVPREDGGVNVSAVNTGLFPLRIEAFGGTSERVTSGEVAHIFTTETYENLGLFKIDPHLSLSFWWWIFLILFCAWPLLYSILVGIPVEEVAQKDVKQNSELHDYEI